MFVEGKTSLQGTLDLSCAYGEDQARRNEENYGFAFLSILTSTVVSGAFLTRLGKL